MTYRNKNVSAKNCFISPSGALIRAVLNPCWNIPNTPANIAINIIHVISKLSMTQFINYFILYYIIMTQFIIARKY